MKWGLSIKHTYSRLYITFRIPSNSQASMILYLHSWRGTPIHRKKSKWPREVSSIAFTIFIQTNALSKASYNIQALKDHSACAYYKKFFKGLCKVMVNRFLKYVIEMAFKPNAIVWRWVKILNHFLVKINPFLKNVLFE